MSIDIRKTFPLTHQQGVHILTNAQWTPEELETLRSASLAELHHGVGTVLRNHWYLHERSSPMARYYATHFGLGHADDMSHLLLAEFKANLEQQPCDLQAQVAWIKKHWADQGVDPLTLERLP